MPAGFETHLKVWGIPSMAVSISVKTMSLDMSIIHSGRVSPSLSISLSLFRIGNDNLRKAKRPWGCYTSNDALLGKSRYFLTYGAGVSFFGWGNENIENIGVKSGTRVNVS